MAIWNPWRGCHKHSEECKYCYIHKGDFKRGIDTNNIVKTNHFYAPIAKNKSGQTVYLCFSTDFLVADADEWRIERFMDCIPKDWKDELVVVGGESDRNARPLDYVWVLSIPF